MGALDDLILVDPDEAPKVYSITIEHQGKIETQRGAWASARQPDGRVVSVPLGLGRDELRRLDDHRVGDLDVVLRPQYRSHAPRARRRGSSRKVPAAGVPRPASTSSRRPLSI